MCDWDLDFEDQSGSNTFDEPEDSSRSFGDKSRGGFRGRGGRGRGGGGRGGGGMTCYKCQQEGHMSRDCPEAGESNGGGGRGGGGRGCFKCGEEGHMSRDCPSGGGGGGGGKRGCFKCGEEGHMSRDCPSGGGDSRACYKCKEQGHMSRDCPNADADENGDDGSRRRSGGDRPKGCFNCGEEGHQKADCPNPAKEEELGPDGKPRPPLYVPEHISDEKLFDEGVDVGNNFAAYENIPVTVSGEKVPRPIDSFEDSSLRPLLLTNVRKCKYTRPTPIQRHCIPTIMAGRDIMGCAQTGSGKTAAFMLPILHSLLEAGEASSNMLTCAEPSALVVAPTRELAVQIHNEGRKFAMDSVVRVVVIYGGASTGSQYRQLQAGCSVLVATPGRLSDFLDRKYVTLSKLKFLVLDEADRMLDMGFASDIEKLMNQPSMPQGADRQTLLFSATFPEEIQQLGRRYLREYVFYAVGTVGAANTDVVQELLNVPKNSKRETLINKLNDINSESGTNKVLVFVETKRTADFLAAYLSSQKISSTSIHGDRFQSQREQALSEFKAGVRNVLVATAVAARGLDIKGVSHVINYDLPKEVDEYVHRIGRTGRVGNKGMAISFYDEDVDGPLAKNLVKILSEAKQTVPEWLNEFALNSGHSLTYDGANPSTDIRGCGQSYMESSSQAFGGPAPCADDDLVWD